MMKIGLQTIAWHDCDDRIEEPLRAAKLAGFQGVEISQRVSIGRAEWLCTELDNHGLMLAGVSGGAIDSRLELAQHIDQTSNGRFRPYVYAESWTAKDDAMYLSSGMKSVISIHPHMFKPIQTLAEALLIKSRFPYVRFMPDTAHTTIAGDNVLAFIDEYFEDIAAVHIKDWTPEYGSSLPFYSSGFVSLGKGRVPVLEVVDLLKSRQFEGWIIAEQDFASSPLDECLAARRFLKSLGV